MILVIDNYDSFTYNLVQYIGEINPDIQIFRNDKITVAEALALNPTHIVISPGPRTPDEAGISLELIKNCPPTIPLLGVCLGHQSMAQAFGGDVIRAPYLMHGKVSQMNIIAGFDSLMFQDMGENFIATRYHSLIVKKETIPDCFKITAETEDGIIMAMEHTQRPLFGLQFHPESIRTDHGKTMIKNFLKISTSPSAS